MKIFFYSTVVLGYLALSFPAISQEIKTAGTSYYSSQAYVLDGRMHSTVPLTFKEIDFLLFSPEPLFVNGKLLKKRNHMISAFLSRPSERMQKFPR